MEQGHESGYVKSTTGPKGLGDPDDMTLRTIERNVKIPQKMREKARIEKCRESVEAFRDCAQQNKFMFFLNCRKENALMKECLGKYFNNEEFRKECTKEYLEERAVYRRTGQTVIPEKLHR